MPHLLLSPQPTSQTLSPHPNILLSHIHPQHLSTMLMPLDSIEKKKEKLSCFTVSSVCKTEVLPNRNELISALLFSCAIPVSQDPNSPLSAEPSIRGVHLTCTARAN